MSSVLVWAVGFANLPLLYGLAAAGVPVLIHLLNRRRFKEVSWAAMQFLLAAVRKNRRRIRIEQWLLLAIRTLVVILVVMAMAKPFLETFGAVIAGRRTHRVLVLDDSLSMGYTSGESSRFEEAKAVASQLVKDSRGGDAISLILMGDPPRVAIGDPQHNLSAWPRGSRPGRSPTSPGSSKWYFFRPGAWPRARSRRRGLARPLVPMRRGASPRPAAVPRTWRIVSSSDTKRVG